MESVRIGDREVVMELERADPTAARHVLKPSEADALPGKLLDIFIYILMRQFLFFLLVPCVCVCVCAFVYLCVRVCTSKFTPVADFLPSFLLIFNSRSLLGTARGTCAASAAAHCRSKSCFDTAGRRRKTRWKGWRN